MILRVLSASLLVASALTAQVENLKPGTPVVVFAPALTVQPLAGKVVSINNERITVASSDLTTAIPWQYVTQVDYDKGRLYLGTALGAAFGALAGAVSYAIGEGEPPSGGQIGSMLSGALVFGLVGSLFNGRRWQVISGDKLPKSGALPVQVAVRDGAIVRITAAGVTNRHVVERSTTDSIFLVGQPPKAWVNVDTIRAAVGPNKFYGGLLGFGVGALAGTYLGKKSGDKSINGYVWGFGLLGAFTLARPLAPPLRPAVAVRPK